MFEKPLRQALLIDGPAHGKVMTVRKDQPYVIIESLLDRLRTTTFEEPDIDYMDTDFTRYQTQYDRVGSVGDYYIFVDRGDCKLKTLNNGFGLATYVVKRLTEELEAANKNPHFLYSENRRLEGKVGVLERRIEKIRTKVKELTNVASVI